MWDDSFAQLSLSPLSITQGDIAQNLANISLGVFDPLDTQAKQIKACLDIGVPMSSLQALFELVRDGAASINLVEQGHASAAVILRQHQQLHERMLRARSIIHESRAMLVPARGLGSRVAQIESELEQLELRSFDSKPFTAFSRLLSDRDVATALGGDNSPEGWTGKERLAKRWELFRMLPFNGVRFREKFAVSFSAENAEMPWRAGRHCWMS